MSPLALHAILPALAPSLRVAQGDSPETIIRVLVIENGDDDREALLQGLRQANVRDHILFVRDGRKARELLVQIDDLGVQSDLIAIFLDLNLTGGIEILRLIRSRPGTARLPVIVMTGSDNPEDMQECRRLHVTSYISKPVAFQPFCMAIANVFNLPIPATWQANGI